MKKKAIGKKPVGRPRAQGRRPVISVRVHEPLYESVRKAARDQGLTISEETERRLQRSFEWEQQFGDIKKMQAESEAIVKRGFEAALRQAGYQPIRVDQGRIWAEPGMETSRVSLSVDAAAIVHAMEPELAEILARALAKVSKKEDQT